MARKPYYNEHSNEESHLRFKSAVTQLGMRTSPLTDLVHDIPVDAVRLGDRLGELRKPGRTFYEQTYAEANAVAQILVRLGLHEHVSDLRRLEPPKPDIEVLLDDRPPVYVEQTMVMDEGARKLSNAVDEINYAVLHTSDEEVRGTLAGGILLVRLERLTPAHYDSGFDVAAITSEIVSLAHALKGESAHTPVGPDYPQLHALRAAYTYRHGARSGSVIQLLTDHGRTHLVEAALRGQIRKKIEAATLYPPECRPLWLLLDIEHHFGLESFTALAQQVIASENPTPFDRVIVQSMYADPLVVDRPFA